MLLWMDNELPVSSHKVPENRADREEERKETREKQEDEQTVQTQSDATSLTEHGSDLVISSI